jgi:hypothetical protein
MIFRTIEDSNDLFSLKIYFNFSLENSMKVIVTFFRATVV